jgi:hypothetical protein
MLWFYGAVSMGTGHWEASWAGAFECSAIALLLAAWRFLGSLYMLLLEVMAETVGMAVATEVVEHIPAHVPRGRGWSHAALGSVPNLFQPSNGAAFLRLPEFV